MQDATIHSEMAPATLLYAASMNPPRRAKRPRIDEPSTLARAPQTAGAGGNATDSDDEGEGDEGEKDQLGDNVGAVPPPKRRGRKPSTLSRAARENMRRQNHSRIEKARRTKINDALATLRRLVPAAAGMATAAEEEEDEDGEFDEGKKKKAKQEKEFKLEVLERTVFYVQELQDRVRTLEAAASRSGGAASTLLSEHLRKRVRADESRTTVGEDNTQGLSPNHSGLSSPGHGHGSSSPAMHASNSSSPNAHPSPLLLPTQSTSALDRTSRPRLPSISSWLAPPPLSPKLQAGREPRERKRSGIVALQPQRPPHASLPTPPTSGTLGPTAAPAVPPALVLELPAAASASSMSRSEAPWTPEDETAASLLLQIRTAAGASPKYSRVQTPASLLGMNIPRV